MLGSISWNLPSSLSYTSYSFLFPVVTVSNPTGATRQYQIVFRIGKQGQVLAEYTPYDWFAVAAGSYATLFPVVWIDTNGVTLSCVLKEKDSNTEIAALSTELVTAATEIMQQIAQPVMTLLTMGMMMSLLGMGQA